MLRAGCRFPARRASGLGPELVTNGTFPADASGWTASTSTTVSWDSGAGGRIQVAGTDATGVVKGNGWQQLACIAGKEYLVRVAPTASVGLCGFGVGNSVGNVSACFSGYLGSAWPAQLTFVASAAAMFLGLFINTVDGTQLAFFDNISVRQLLLS